MNRIDSRARGNAPQLLEKYRKLAHDAHLNGDRVQEEYYLQFADHYFRVLADQKQRQEESRQPRRDDRQQQDSSDDYGSDDDTYGDNGHSGSQQGGHQGGNGDQDRAPRGERESRARGSSEEQPESAGATDTGQDETGSEPRSIYEPDENPFVRDNRTSTRAPKARKPRRKSRDDDGEASDGGESDQEAGSGNFDPATLPPSISAKASEKPAAGDEAAGEKPKRRRTTRKAAPPADDANGSLEAVNG
ncbi:DUF4167 domain-containing protein [Novosphingobium sp. 2580]|uniref:DUF4167 domain-containing protein n=2 Tax=Novosphingobium album (ex Hu et al. 2023) TaxID=2930093 RepID=A0ABT0B2K3_9SPHN|nr:DUF4167 domain-containing protein [Novosphingobium album (ex Hu et al. 2023)]